MKYLGDFTEGSVVRVFFSTKDYSGTPATILTPTVKVYKNSSTTTESTTGVSTNIDYDSTTGFHMVEVDTSASASFYEKLSDFSIVLTAGTVGGVSQAGTVLGQFSVQNRHTMLEERTGDHNTGGTYGRKLKNIGEDLIYSGTAVSATENTIVLDSGASSTNGAYDPSQISITDGTGAGQTRMVLEYVGSTRTAVVDRDWKITPDGTSVFIITANPGREHVNEGMARGGSANTITLNTLASSTDNAYVGQIVFIRSGTGEDQARRVASYDGTTKIATVTRNWGVVPDTASAYSMLPTGALSYQCIRDAIGMATADMDTQLDAILAAAAIDSGTGSADVTLTVNDASSNPVADCEVWITSDSDGTTVVAGPQRTQDDGTVEFRLDAGSTYYCWRKKAGYNFTNPAQFVAVGD